MHIFGTKGRMEDTGRTMVSCLGTRKLSGVLEDRCDRELMGMGCIESNSVASEGMMIIVLTNGHERTERKGNSKAR